MVKEQLCNTVKDGMQIYPRMYAGWPQSAHVLQQNSLLGQQQVPRQLSPTVVVLGDCHQHYTDQSIACNKRNKQTPHVCQRLEDTGKKTRVFAVTPC
jgi:hypothetical protein